MNKVKLLIITLLLATTGCSAQKSTNLKNTKWVYDFGGGYKSYYLFLEGGNYEYHDAETGDILKGTYEKQKDVVILSQKSGQYDNEFEEGSRHRVEKKQFKLLIRNNNELGLYTYWNQDKNRWQEDAFVFKKE
jgi:hypothetical protein